MAPPPALCQSADLTDFPGAPFTQDVVDSAIGEVRAAAHWHIAPQITETVTVRAYGGFELLLPTLNLVSLSAVRDVTDPANPITLSGWDSSPTAEFKRGIVGNRFGWPCRRPYAVLEVDVVHGFETCPPDLLPVIAQTALDFRRNRAVSSESVGSVSASYGSLAGSVFNRYVIPVI